MSYHIIALNTHASDQSQPQYFVNSIMWPLVDLRYVCFISPSPVFLHIPRKLSLFMFPQIYEEVDGINVKIIN